jgi:hypothetical protein
MNVVPWPLLRKISFRFFAVFIGLYIIFWVLMFIPLLEKVNEIYGNIVNGPIVTLANKYIFHVRPKLVPTNGSGDTSFDWAQLDLYLLIALIGCLAWSVIDRKRLSYNKLNYWLILIIRYFIAMTAFSYGIMKLFALQMSVPSVSMLATPLGDLSAMRLSWLFIGYSPPYQIFSGVMEVLVGLLLCWRRTATFGALLATAVFINVMMLNFSYDVVVKIFSILMVVMCLFLLANEYKRIICFFVLNQRTPAGVIYQNELSGWMGVTRVVVKIIFLIITLGITTYETQSAYKRVHSAAAVKPILPGLYNVKDFKLGSDSVGFTPENDIRWRDVVFDLGGGGSVNSADSMFRQRYHRGYFFYSVDTLKCIIHFKKTPTDSVGYLSLAYEIPNDHAIRLRGNYRQKSLYVELEKSNHKFQLAERQFNWLSERPR